MVVSKKQIRDDEAATDLLFKALADPIRRDALRRARSALDRLETDWRDRIERMEQILETDKGDN